MLGPEPLVLIGRQAFLDAQRLLSPNIAISYGFYDIGWYGTALSDERGSFAVVDPMGPLAHAVGDVVEIAYYPLLIRWHEVRKVRVYVIGSQQDLGFAMAITRRNYLALELLAIEPINCSVAPVGADWGRGEEAAIQTPAPRQMTWGRLRDTGMNWDVVNARYPDWVTLRDRWVWGPYRP